MPEYVVFAKAKMPKNSVVANGRLHSPSLVHLGSKFIHEFCPLALDEILATPTGENQYRLQFQSQYQELRGVSNYFLA